MFEQPVVANRAMLKFVEILSEFVEICRICRICRSQLFFEFLAKSEFGRLLRIFGAVFAFSCELFLIVGMRMFKGDTGCAMWW